MVTGSFDDVTKAYEASVALADKGVDVIWHQLDLQMLACFPPWRIRVSTQLVCTVIKAQNLPKPWQLACLFRRLRKPTKQLAVG